MSAILVAVSGYPRIPSRSKRGDILQRVAHRLAQLSEDATKKQGPGKSKNHTEMQSVPLDIHAALPLVMGRHPRKHPEFRLPLYSLLINFRRSKCGDQRDRIFALSGLINLDERCLLQRFFPDYSLNHEDVAAIALAHLMQFDRKDITLQSDDISLGLGIEWQAQKKRLLHRAERFDYLHAEADSAMFLRIRDSISKTEHIYLDRSGEEQVNFSSYDWENPGSRAGGGTCCLILIFVILIAVGVRIFTKCW